MGRKGKKGGEKGAQQPAGDKGGKAKPSGDQQKKAVVDPKPGPSGDPGITTTQAVKTDKKAKQVHPPRSETSTPSSDSSQPRSAWGPDGNKQQTKTGKQVPAAWGNSGHQQQQQERQWGQQHQGQGKAIGARAPHQQQKQGQTPSPVHQQQQKGQHPPGWGPSGTQQQQQQQLKQGQTPSPVHQQQQKDQHPPGWGPSGTQQPQQHRAQPPPGWGMSGIQQQQQQQRGQTPLGWGASGSQPQQQREEIQATAPKSGPQRHVQEGDIEKDLQKLSVSPHSQPERSTKKQGIQQTGLKEEKKSLVIRSIVMDYNIDPKKSGLPIKWCGSAGTKHQIEANYLDLNLNKMPDIAYQYDVKFNIERPTRFRPEAFEQFRRNVLNQGRGPVGFPIAFDTMNIAFSAERVPASLLNVSHPVICIDSATGAEKKIEITINEAGTVELHLLKNYGQTGITDRHIRAVQCIDVVLRTAPAQISKQIGRAFYRRPDNPADLGDGFDLWLGLFQALVLGEVPMLNIDIAHKGFPRADNLLQIYDKYGRDTEYFLKNLNIIYDPPRSWNGMSKLYKANGLVRAANQETFVNENKQTLTVAEYYQSKNYPLKRPDAPCVSVGTVRKICLPLELCHVQEGQDVKKKAGTNQVRELIKHAATSTFVRKQKIMQLFSEINYNRAEILRGFNVSIGEQFKNLMARNIRPPKIKYANGSIEPQRGSWRQDRLTYLKSAAITKWAILVTANRISDGAIGKFANMIKEEAAKHNMGFSDYVKYNESNVRNLPKMFEKFKSEGRSIVFVIISGAGDSYSKVKQIAEINYGLLTQCVKAYTVERRMDPSTIANIFLKVNSKLNGINHMLEPSNAVPMVSNSKEAVMFLGADVTHPSPDQSLIPSVVGVAGSYDSYAFQYKFSWRLQDPRAEMISDMENIMIDQLRNFEQKRGRLPTHIIYYRDGVSNGQFKELERVELNAINRACAKFQKYKPCVTCLVVQKRHHTRFFPVSKGIVHPRDKNQNVLPGTVVDTTITHPGEKQFFLVSHESIQGTAKPSKYCILRDDANFTADELQAMTYSLCHLFTRCNRAVSYPAPAYYAHHVAARGRVYIEGARINLNNLSREYETRNVDAIIRSNPLFFV